ncbi:protein translocase subunit SecD [bacterium]|nr:protein translocase subunit SecD [bacterium]
MGRKNTFKIIFIFLLVLWALYSLWPSFTLWTMNPQERETLKKEGKLVSLESKAIRMGLDLQGGIYLVYETDFPELIKQLARSTDDDLNGLLQACREEMNVSAEPFLDILAAKCAADNIPLSRYWGERGDSDSDILAFLRTQASNAVDRALRKLRNRIDRFGVSEPVIQRQGLRRIIIQLPGVMDPERAKEQIGKTALLELKLLVDSDKYGRTIEKIDRLLAQGTSAGLSDTTAAESDTTSQSVQQKEREDKAISVSELFGDEPGTAETASSDTSLLVDEALYKENPFISLLATTGQMGREVLVPINNVAAIDRILAREDVQALIPEDAEFLWGSEEFTRGEQRYRFLYLVKKKAEITGQYLTETRVSISQDPQYAGMPEVHFTLNREGSRIFSRVTGANAKKFLAIVLDDKVMSAPQIQGKITGGRSRITGIGNMQEAKDLSVVLEVGALPAPIQIVQENQVDATLGKDSIQKGSYSALFGLILVILFMVVYYKFSGLIADLALLMNLVILMAVLAQFHFTLTLPGIAGIILTVGMAVDANVLVFERIREELRTGKTVRAAIEAGYSRAFRTIFDANLTTLFTALVLYQFGTGPIRGFAVTLSIGIVVSMFTALVVTRVIYDGITSRKTLTKLSI